MVEAVPIENAKQRSILWASSLSMVVATVLVVLRIIAKRIGSRIDYSDYCILLAWIANIGLHTDQILLCVYGGFGFHLQDIFARFGPDNATFFFKGIMSFALLWNANAIFTKISVLLMYLAIFPMPSMLLWCQWVALFITLWCVANIFVGIFICRPIRRNWDFTVQGSCGSQRDWYFSMGVINILTDVVLIGLPMPYLYKIRLPTPKKILAMGLLSIGIGTWVITIYRQVALKDLVFADMTHSGVLATILSGIEPSVAIALACIPLLRPLWGRSESDSKNSGYDFSNGSSKKSNMYSSRSKTRDQNPIDTVDDTSSEIYLRPVEAEHSTKTSTNHVIENSCGKTHVNGAEGQRTITVERRWEVNSE
ncbi:hypothetical protein BKA63DRAFT_530547 [Paraphoma chrysanthemicola]|nr:hypothetical protein BKA63DRAFT_530547 [Paraphoma chrysanthemicola]